MGPSPDECSFSFFETVFPQTSTQEKTDRSASLSPPPPPRTQSRLKSLQLSRPPRLFARPRLRASSRIPPSFLPFPSLPPASFFSRMLAQRLAENRTVMSSERVSPVTPRLESRRFELETHRGELTESVPPSSPFGFPLCQDVGTQTSLSFETSSSIRNELLLYLEEQGMLDDQEEEGGKDKSQDLDGRSYVLGVGDMSIEELRAVSRNSTRYKHMDWWGILEVVVWEPQRGQGRLGLARAPGLKQVGRSMHRRSLR